MSKIIWMSDPHFQKDRLIDGINPRKRLSLAIEHANRHHSDAAFIVLSGDLAGDEGDDNYAALAEQLGKSNLPIYPMMGNHDSRASMRAHLNVPETAMPDFIQYSLDLPDAKILCLDTHKLGSHAGQFCQTRQDWLNQTLSQCADKSAYIFMHHPPLALQLPAQDEIMLEQADAFLDIISAHSNVKHLFMGHVHYATSGSLRGIPFASLGALSFQAPPPRPAWTWDTFEQPHDAPHFGVLYIEEQSVVLQPTKFCAFQDGFEG